MGESGTGGARGPGAIELICGCMCSGKTERLLDRLRAAAESGVTSIAFKHASDVRYAGAQLASHNGRHWNASPVSTADEILQAVGTARLIVIDEGQFFGRELLE